MRKEDSAFANGLFCLSIPCCGYGFENGTARVGILKKLSFASAMSFFCSKEKEFFHMGYHETHVNSISEVVSFQLR